MIKKYLSLMLFALAIFSQFLGCMSPIDGETLNIDTRIINLENKAAYYMDLEADNNCILYGYHSASGGFIDISGNDNHGNITGDIWEKTKTGLYTSHFNGDDRVSLGQNDNFNIANTDFTLIFWYYKEGNWPTYGYNYIQSFSGGFTTNGYAIWGNDETNRLIFLTYPSGTYHDTRSASLTAGNYYFCALIKNGSSAQWYINGEASGTPGNHPNDAADASGETFYIGWANYYMESGYIDLFRIYNIPLTTNIISDIYESEKSLFGIR